MGDHAPLERLTTARLYWNVSTDELAPATGEQPMDAAPTANAAATRRASLRRVLDAGVIAVASTAGAIAGFGLHRGGMLEPFAFTGRLLLGVAPTENGAPRQMALFAGVLAHIGCVLLWSILFVRLAGRARGVRLVVFALAFAAVSSLVDRRILPVSLRLGHGVSDTATQTMVLYMVLALALVVGMRLAKLDGHAGLRSSATSPRDVDDA